MLNTLTKKIVQKLYKMHNKTNAYKTLNLYIFCMQRLYKSKFCIIMNVHKKYIKFLYIYKNCTNCSCKTCSYKVLTKNALQLEMYVVCTYKQCTNYTKAIQLAKGEHQQWGLVTLYRNLAVNLKTTHSPLLSLMAGVNLPFLKTKLSHTLAGLLFTHQNLNFLEINSFWETMNYFTHVETPDK